MEQELKEYIESEMRRTSHPKYHRYIGEYIANLTPMQVSYWNAWKDGRKTIW